MEQLHYDGTWRGVISIKKTKRMTSYVVSTGFLDGDHDGLKRWHRRCFPDGSQYNVHVSAEAFQDAGHQQIHQHTQYSLGHAMYLLSSAITPPSLLSFSSDAYAPSSVRRRLVLILSGQLDRSSENHIPHEPSCSLRYPLLIRRYTPPSVGLRWWLLLLVTMIMAADSVADNGVMRWRFLHLPPPAFHTSTYHHHICEGSHAIFVVHSHIISSRVAGCRYYQITSKLRGFLF